MISLYPCGIDAFQDSKLGKIEERRSQNSNAHSSKFSLIIGITSLKQRIVHAMIFGCNTTHAIYHVQGLNG